MPGVFSHPLARILANALIQMGHGTDPALDPLQDWPVYYSNEVDSPDKVIITFRTDSIQGHRIQIDGARDELHGFNFRVRGGEVDETEAKAHAIRESLNGVYQMQVDVGASRYLIHCFVNVADVVDNGKDPTPTKRSIFTINGLVQIEPMS